MMQGGPRAREKRRRHFDSLEGAPEETVSFYRSRSRETTCTGRGDGDGDDERAAGRDGRGMRGRGGGDWEGGCDNVSRHSPNVLRFWMDIRQTKEIPRMIQNCGAQVTVVGQERGEMLLDRHLNSAWTPPENRVDKTKRDGRVRSRK